MSEPSERFAELVTKSAAAHPQPKAAADAVLKALKADPDLMEALLSRLINDAVTTAIYQARHSIKLAVKAGPNAPRGLELMLGYGKAMEDRILDTWQMPDGRLIGDWTGKELLEEAVNCQNQANGLLQNAQIYQTVGNRAGAKAVRSVLDNKQMRSIVNGVMGTTAKKKAG